MRRDVPTAEGGLYLCNIRSFHVLRHLGRGRPRSPSHRLHRQDHRASPALQKHHHDNCRSPQGDRPGTRRSSRAPRRPARPRLRTFNPSRRRRPTYCRGRSPKRSANCSMSHAASAFGHLATSSHQAAANCGPRNRSGSLAERTVASTPLRQCSTLPLMRGRCRIGCTASNPLSPRTITAIASVIVWPTSAIGVTPAAASWRTHSAPARVLPEPRPPNISHVVQSPLGASCSARAQRSQL